MASNGSGIVRAIVASSAELGAFSSALLLLRSVASAGPAAIASQVRQYGRELPLFDAIVRSGIGPEDVDDILDAVVEAVGQHLDDGVADVVCTAMEAELIDRLVVKFPGHGFTVVRHNPAAETSRVVGNYGPNFKLVDAHEIEDVANPLSTALIVPVFDAGSDSYVTTYPNTLRILGPDAPTRFAEVVAADLLNSVFYYNPFDMVRISIRHFTKLVHISAAGSSAAYSEEVAA